jgi:hypothetical protein
VDTGAHLYIFVGAIMIEVLDVVRLFDGKHCRQVVRIGELSFDPFPKTFLGKIQRLWESFDGDDLIPATEADVGDNE